MRRAVVLVLTLSIPACHRSEAAPKDAPSATSPEASTTGAELPLDSGDPAVLSRSAETVAQIEPALGLGSDGTLAIGWMGLRPGKPTLIGARLSRDLGTTWTPVQALLAPEGRDAADPVVGVSVRGDVFLAWRGLRPDPAGGDPHETHIYVARAAAGSTEIGAVTDLTDHMRRGTLVDAPSLAMTPGGTALVTWKYTAEGGNGIGITRGDAEGRWTAGKVIERVGLQAWLPSVCASGHGDRVWVAYVDAEAGVRVRASDDGAASWSPARATTVSLAEEKPRLAVETPVCSGDGDDVAVVYGRTREPRDDSRSPGLDSIVVARSFDGGRTYDWRRVIDLGADVVAMHPQVAREPDGTLDVAFYASASGAGGADAGDSASLRVVRLAPTGTAVPPARIVGDHIRIARDRKSAAWPGEHFGFAWHEGKTYIASIDATGDLSHVAFTALSAK